LNYRSGIRTSSPFNSTKANGSAIKYKLVRAFERVDLLVVRVYLFFINYEKK
jgi:hypothetical protein|tara:strand:- start:944 stop:1099 length:156 start_codon:yes stop_codon:yes gene_type:complete